MSVLRRQISLYMFDILLIPAWILLKFCIANYEMNDNKNIREQYIFQLDAEEGFILNQALALKSGETIYPPINAGPPWIVGNYPPLFPSFYSYFLKNPESGLVTGRQLVSCSIYIIGFLFIVFAIWKSNFSSLFSGLLCSALFLNSYEVRHWSQFVRVDFFALMLTVIGMMLFVSSHRRMLFLVKKKIKGSGGVKYFRLVFAGLFFVAAFYTKQTSIFAPLACLVALMPDKKKCFWFALPSVLVAFFLFIYFQISTHGEFYRHLVTYNLNIMDWAAWRRVMVNEIWFFHRWWIIAMAVLVMALIVKKFRNPGVRVSTINRALTLWALFSMGSLLAYAKVGAAPNYVLEPLAAVAIWMTTAYASLGHRASKPYASWKDRFVIFSVAGLLIIHALWLFPISPEKMLKIQKAFNIKITPGCIMWADAPQLLDKENSESLLVGLKEFKEKGQIFTEEPIFSLMLGQPVILQPFIMSQLAKEGQWDESPFVHMLENREFSAILTTEDFKFDVKSGTFKSERYTDTMAQAILVHYTLKKVVRLSGGVRFKTYFLWTPNP